MFSPKAYLLEFLSKNLSDWIEDVKEDSVDVGILSTLLHKTYASPCCRSACWTATCI